MDTYYIKINGKANIEKPLIIDQSYKVVADCSITEDRKNSNEDGTFSITFKAEPLTVEIVDTNGKVLKAKDPHRNSQKIRNYLFKLYTMEGYTEPFDDVYDMFTQEVMSVSPQLLKSAIARLNQ